MKIPLNSFFLIPSFWLAFAPLNGLRAADVIVPQPGNLNGNSSFAPFDTSFSGRFQQVYDSSAFSSLPPGGGRIYYVYFRVDASVGHSFAAIATNLQLNLSTTTRTPDNLSTTFEENVGTDDAVVLGPASIGISGAGGGGVTSFNVGFNLLSNPFSYDPANGNLLLDFRIHTGIGTLPQGIAILDAFDMVGDSVSCVYGYGGSLPDSGQLSSLGLATAFSFIVVPEPSAWLLSAIGVLALILGRAVRRGRM